MSEYHDLCLIPAVSRHLLLHYMSDLEVHVFKIMRE
jgi:hypothetical protein